MAPPAELQQPVSLFRIRLLGLLLEFQHKILSRTSVERLLNKINSISVSKEGKIEAVHGLLQQQETLCLLETCYEARRGGESHKLQASVNDVIVTNGFFFCGRMADTNIGLSLNERMMLLQSTLHIHDIRSELSKSEALRKRLLCF